MLRLVSKLNPFPGMKHLDVAGGTGLWRCHRIFILFLCVGLRRLQYVKFWILIWSWICQVTERNEGILNWLEGEVLVHKLLDQTYCLSAQILPIRLPIFFIKLLICSKLFHSWMSTALVVACQSIKGTRRDCLICFYNI